MGFLFLFVKYLSFYFEGNVLKVIFVLIKYPEN